MKSNRIVHHRRYTMEVLTGDDLSALVTVCDPCHQVIEFVAHDEHRSRIDQEWVLDFMRKEMGQTTPLRRLD
jgi:hypothetical protein